MASCKPVATPVVVPDREPTLPAFVVPDEKMSFIVSFRGIDVADVQTAIGQLGWVDGKRSVIIKSRGKADGLIAMIGDMRWELETTVDLGNGTPTESHEEAWMEAAGEKKHEDHHNHGADLDIHAAIATLGGWHSAPQQHREVKMQIGGGHFPLEIWQTTRTSMRGRPALKYEGTADHDVPFSIWISDDAARVPLRAETATEIGTIAVTLIDYI